MRNKDSILLESAYYQILEEGRRERYMEMFKGIPEQFESFYKESESKDPTKWKLWAENLIDKDVNWAIETLKREDRIMWFLRSLKAILYAKSSMKDFVFRDSLKRTKEKPQPTWLKKSPIGDLIIDRMFHDQNVIWLIDMLKEDLTHFLSLGIPQIDNFRFDNQKWEDVKRDFKQYEKEWAEKQKSWIDITNELKEGKISPVVVFDDGFRWFNLNRPQCGQEGKAMGHCGNCGGRNDDTILSLRKLKQEGGRMYARPSLTFILHHNGQLGEMKGRGNNKPNEKYHPYILRLLAQKNLVKGIEGGGYLPQNNFSLNDLNDERLEAFFDARPDILIEDTTSLKKVIRYYISKDKVLPEGFLNLQTAHGSWPLAADIAFEYGNFLMNKNKELPHILFQSIGQDSIYSLSFAEYMMDNDMEIPEILLHAISKDGERSFDLASQFFEKNKEIPEILINGLVGFSSLSMRLLSLYLNTNRKTKWEERLLNSISKRPDNSIEFARLLMKKGMEIPEVITKSVDRDPFDAVRFASMMIRAGKRVADNIIYTISTDPESSEIIAEYMVRHNYKNIPEIILKSISENNEMTKDFADFLKKRFSNSMYEELPPILKTFVNPPSINN